jgi:hypothetical protein
MMSATEGGQQVRQFSTQTEAGGAAAMEHLQNGQCGLCTHFGESHHTAPALVSIMKSHEAPLNMVDECGHPKHATLHLKVTPISGCDGFTPVASA